MSPARPPLSDRFSTSWALFSTGPASSPGESAPAKAPPAPTDKVPAVMVVPPVKVLAPVRLSVPEPVLVSVPPALVRPVSRVTFWPLVSRL